jgi:hypothetical protein
MSRLVLRNDWKAAMMPKVYSTQKVEYSGSFKPAIQWLVVNFLKAHRAYKIYNCGAGVQTITTETDICPCCQQKAKL